MIAYKDLIEDIQDQLNTAINSTENGAFVYDINGVLPNTAFEFSITSDSGEYKAAEKGRVVVNGVPWATYFINGNARYSPQMREGEAPSAYNAVITATVDFLVPVARLTAGEQTDDFIAEIRRLIDDTLSASASKYVTADDIIYLVQTRYSLLQTGERAQRDQTGDSIILTMYVDFCIVANGIQSSAVELTIDGERVIPSKLGFARKIISETGVPANSTNGASKVISGGSSMTINMDLPAKCGAFNKKYAAYVFTGANPAMTVTVKYPQEFSAQGVPTTLTYTFSMIFDNSGINTEQGYAVSASVTLVEVM